MKQLRPQSSKVIDPTSRERIIVKGESDPNHSHVTCGDLRSQGSNAHRLCHNITRDRSLNIRHLRRIVGRPSFGTTKN